MVEIRTRASVYSASNCPSFGPLKRNLSRQLSWTGAVSRMWACTLIKIFFIKLVVFPLLSAPALEVVLQIMTVLIRHSISQHATFTGNTFCSGCEVSQWCTGAWRNFSRSHDEAWRRRLKYQRPRTKEADAGWQIGCLFDSCKSTGD